MEVILSECLGFCYGVKRAIKIAEEHADGKSNTLGPIIHNPQMVARLAEEGVGRPGEPAEEGDAVPCKIGGNLVGHHGVGINDAGRRNVVVGEAFVADRTVNEEELAHLDVPVKHAAAPAEQHLAYSERVEQVKVSPAGGAAYLSQYDKHVRVLSKAVDRERILAAYVVVGLYIPFSHEFFHDVGKEGDYHPMRVERLSGKCRRVQLRDRFRVKFQNGKIVPCNHTETG